MRKTKFQLLTYFITISIVGIILLIVLKIHRTTEGELIKQFSQQQLMLAKQTAMGIKGFIDERITALKILAEHPYSKENKTDFCVKKCQRIFNKVGGFLSIEYTDVDGTIKYGCPETKVSIGLNIKKSNDKAAQLLYQDFLNCKKTRQTIVSKPLMSSQKGLIFFVSTPVFDENEFKGVVIGTFRVSEVVNKFAEPVKPGKTGFAWIMASNGTLLYNPKYSPGDNVFDTVIKDKNSELYKLVEKMSDGKEGLGEYIASYGTKKLTAYTPIHIENESWSVNVNAPYSEITKLIYKSQQDTIILIITIIFMALLANSFILKTNKKRIAAEENAKYLEEEKKLKESLKNKNDELEISCKQLQAITSELQKSKRKLEQNYKFVQNTNTELERLNKMKSDFLSIASHELKTPLVTSIGYIEHVLESNEEEIPKTLRNFLEKALNSNKKLSEIINEILDISRIESHRLKLRWEKVALKDLIQGSINDLAFAIKDRKQTITVKNLDTLPKISGDQEQLNKVFNNLLSNAIKYTPDKGNISISANLTHSGETSQTRNNKEQKISARFVKIMITDTGIGIAKEEQEHIFDKFYEALPTETHSTSKTKYLGYGTGLGLSICRGIIEEHHGKIWVESDGYDEEKFPGSTFHILLPIEKISTDGHG